MKCDKCRNYQIDMDGTNEGYYTACKEFFYTTLPVDTMTKEYKQDVMDGKRKNCKGFERL
jgi:hypothetical protein